MIADMEAYKTGKSSSVKADLSEEDLDNLLGACKMTEALEQREGM